MADALGLASFGSRHCEATGKPTASFGTGANFDITGGRANITKVAPVPDAADASILDGWYWITDRCGP